MKPSPESDIMVEIWLPDAAVWNGKFLGTGNGGFAGTISTGDLVSSVMRHYATANTDMGTSAAKGYEGGRGHIEMIRDWGYRATHEMTVAAKKVIAAYYGRPQKVAYFAGCSTGGHQGLTEAQRYPDDYNGILAGAAGNNRTHLHLAFLHYFRTMKAAPIPTSTMTAVHKKILAACVGKDGGLANDEFLNNPAACKFNLETLLCKAGENGECLTPPQLGALQALYDGPRNPRNGRTIYPGVAFGAEKYFAMFGAQLATTKAPSDLINWQIGDAFKADAFDFDKDVTALDKAFGPVVNALDADLSAFARHGGKLIMYHGWEDLVVSPYDSVDYYERIKPAASAKLFMVPGMFHCQGGGFDSFGAQYKDGWPADPEHDVLSALDRWVETGKAPGMIVAGSFSGSMSFSGMPPAAPPKLQATRPLCAYPGVARYDGNGDPAKAESFQCKKAPRAKFSRSAGEYRR
jgi:feruloyl esterase